MDKIRLDELAELLSIEILSEEELAEATAGSSYTDICYRSCSATAAAALARGVDPSQVQFDFTQCKASCDNG